MKKKLIISLLSLTIIGTSGALVYSSQKKATEKSSIASNTEAKTSDSTPTKTENVAESTTEKTSNVSEDSKKVENVKEETPKQSDKVTSAAITDKKDSEKNSEKQSNKSEDEKKDTSKPSDTKTNESKPQSSTSFTNGLTRENLNGYYEIIRSDGGIGYGKLTNAGLFTLDQRPSGTVFTSVDKFTPKSSGGGNKFEFQLNGEMTNSSFTVKNANELNANLPNFGDASSYVYKRISQSEYEKGAQELILRENKFSTLGDYYFGNRGYVGTMSSVESTVKINGKEYKIVKSNNSNERVLISLFGQTYNYQKYKSSGSLVVDNSDMYSGFN